MPSVDHDRLRAYSTVCTLSLSLSRLASSHRLDDVLVGGVEVFPVRHACGEPYHGVRVVPDHAALLLFKWFNQLAKKTN